MSYRQTDRQTGRQAGIKTNYAKFKFFHIIENLKLWTLNLLSPISQSRLFGFPDFHKTGKKIGTPFAWKHITIHLYVSLLEPRLIQCRRVCMFDR